MVLLLLSPPSRICVLSIVDVWEQNQHNHYLILARDSCGPGFSRLISSSLRPTRKLSGVFS